MGTNSDLSEEWISYRKLVIDTLSKLDERSQELYEKVADLSNRVSKMEDRNGPTTREFEKEVRVIDEFIDEINTDIKEFEKRLITLETDASVKKAMAQTAKWGIGILWTVLTVAVGWFMSYISQ